ncbi:MAG: MarR family transcriptional regulator [Sphingobium sp.]|nr:MarR family transcriptional regulator [Sphingobium sp.]
MTATLTDADYAALAEFRFALRTFLAFSESKAADCGLTPQQHQALLTIRGAPAGKATVGYVAERLILKPQSATGLVDRMEALGLVRRRPSSQDGRIALLELTDSALETLARLSLTHRQEIRQLRPMMIELLGRLNG